jgi:hypothetical protein
MALVLRRLNLERTEMSVRQIARAARESVSVFLRDVGDGLVEVSHNVLALVGLGVITAAVFALGHADLRHRIEVGALEWLQGRHVARQEADGNLLAVLAEPEAVNRATAADPGELDRQQAAVANWISRRYRVAPEPVSRLVQEAWAVGQRAGLDPTLILAVVAIESRFNPFAQSHMGAQGLMQVITRVHNDKYEPFGGTHAAFDPIANLRVGVQVLKEYVSRAGSVEGGLRWYVGAANLESDGGYVGKVLGEQQNLKLVAGGKSLPANTPLRPAPVTVPTAAPAADTADDAAPAEAGETAFVPGAQATGRQVAMN